MSGLSLDAGDLAWLAARKITKGPGGDMQNSHREPVKDGTIASMLLAHKSGAHPVDPGDYRHGYLAAGHASDSPANGPRGVIPEPPEGSGRPSSLCTTPDPDDDGDVEKVVEPESFDRSYLTAGHATPSPADRPPNSAVAPVTGSGHERYQAGAAAYNRNGQVARAEHVMPSQACVSQPAPAQWRPPPDLGAGNVPQARAAGATGRAPGE